MNTENKPYPAAVPFMQVILIFLLAAMFGVAQAKPFTPPDLEGFNLHDEREADGCEEAT